MDTSTERVPKSAAEFGVIDGLYVKMTVEQALEAIPYLQFSPLKKFGNGGNISYVSLFGQRIIVTFGTDDSPVCFPFGVSEQYDKGKALAEPHKKSIAIKAYPGSIQSKFGEALDARGFEVVAQNSQAWMGETMTAAEIQKNASNPFVQIRDLKRQPIDPRIKVNIDTTSLSVKVFSHKDDDGNLHYLHGSVSDIDKNTVGRIAVEIGGLYFVSSKWGFRKQGLSVIVGSSSLSADEGGSGINAFPDAEKHVFDDKQSAGGAETTTDDSFQWGTTDGDAGADDCLPAGTKRKRDDGETPQVYMGQPI